MGQQLRKTGSIGGAELTNTTPPWHIAKKKKSGGYQVHKALEKYGNKVADLDRYLPWKAATVQVTILRGAGEVPASSLPEPPLCGGCFSARPLRRATYPPVSSKKVLGTIGKDLGSADPVKTAA